MKKAILTLIQIVAFCSLFMVPTDDHITWSFMLDKVIQIAIFILCGYAYDAETKKATK